MNGNVSDILIKRIDNMSSAGLSLYSILNNVNVATNNELFSEAEYNKVVDHLKLEIIDVDRFVKVNNCKPVTNPVFFSRDNIPTDDGLLSNEIFGITQSDRAGVFAYIGLGDWYIDPLCYKIWSRIDRKIKDVIHKTDTFIVDDKGELISDPKGKNGIKFLKDNIDKIKFRSTDSIKRDIRIKYLEKNRNIMFINKYIVIPPYYRDTNTGSRAVGVGGINKLYSQLIVSVNSLKTTQEYGFDMSGAMEARLQETILCIYDWFSGNTNENIKTDTGIGISGKMGVLRRANMTKTSNYTSRLVISAPELKTYNPKEMMSDFDHSAIPLSAAIACFRPFVQFHVKRFFENEFIGTEQYPVLNKDGKITYEIPKDPLIEFSDERIKEEMEKFIHGYNDRFTPIQVPLEYESKVVYMQFKGAFQDPNTNPESIYHRRLTWCDIFYMAAVKATTNKMVLITRYPIDSMFNELTSYVVVSSTKDTEHMYVGGEYYKYYPLIKESDIGSNTGNKFVDTLKMSNLYLKGLGGDYDGDTVIVKGVYTEEANEELKKFHDSKMNFVDLGANGVRSSSADVIQSLYSLTKILPADVGKITKPIF